MATDDCIPVEMELHAINTVKIALQDHIKLEDGSSSLCHYDARILNDWTSQIKFRLIALASLYLRALEEMRDQDLVAEFSCIGGDETHMAMASRASLRRSLSVALNEIGSFPQGQLRAKLNSPEKTEGYPSRGEMTPAALGPVLGGLGCGVGGSWSWEVIATVMFHKKEKRSSDSDLGLWLAQVVLALPQDGHETSEGAQYHLASSQDQGETSGVAAVAALSYHCMSRVTMPPSRSERHAVAYRPMERISRAFNIAFTASSRLGVPGRRRLAEELGLEEEDEEDLPEETILVKSGKACIWGVCGHALAAYAFGAEDLVPDLASCC